MVQCGILIGVAALIAGLLMDLGGPPAFERHTWTQRDGFVAISYQALCRTEKESGMPRERFSAHLKAIRDAGYTFITTQDIVDFYHNNKPLPEKALYLMLEGGRLDNAIFGQQMLRQNSAYAGFYTYTETIASSRNFFVDADKLGLLARSGFWDVSSQGYKLMRFSGGESEKEVFFLCDYLRDQDGMKAETADEMEERLSGYYQHSVEPIKVAIKGPPLAYTFVPANAFFHMPEEIQETNRRLMRQHFRIAFTREGSAFNPAGQSPYDLTRMQVRRDMETGELVAALENWGKERKAYSAGNSELRDDWHTYDAEIAVSEDGLALSPLEKEIINPAFLRGTDLWRDLKLSVIYRRDEGERSIYLRYVSRDCYLRVCVKSNRILVQERLPRAGLATIYESVLGSEDPWELDVLLKGNRIKLWLNGRPVTDGFLPVSPALDSGRVALGVMGQEGYSGRFDDFSVSRLPSVWKEGADSDEAAGRHGEIMAALIRLPSDADREDAALRQLLRSTGSGEVAVAVLEEGELGFQPGRLALSHLDERQAGRLWHGVLLHPASSASWERVNEALRGIRDHGFSPCVRLSLPAVTALVNSGLALEADNFVLDFDKDALAPSVMTAFANKHNRNRFLFAQPGGQANESLYSVRDEW